VRVLIEVSSRRRQSLCVARVTPVILSASPGVKVASWTIFGFVVISGTSYNTVENTTVLKAWQSPRFCSPSGSRGLHQMGVDDPLEMIPAFLLRKQRTA
jgi:hypothetical protein